MFDKLSRSVGDQLIFISFYEMSLVTTLFCLLKGKDYFLTDQKEVMILWNVSNLQIYENIQKTFQSTNLPNKQTHKWNLVKYKYTRSSGPYGPFLLALPAEGLGPLAPVCGFGKGPMGHGPFPRALVGAFSPCLCTVQYSTVQYSTVQYNISTVQYSTVQYCWCHSPRAKILNQFLTNTNCKFHKSNSAKMSNCYFQNDFSPRNIGKKIKVIKSIITIMTTE